MKKMLALLAVLCSTTAAFAQSDAVVRWKTIVGNITVSNNDAVAGINPGTTPWIRTSRTLPPVAGEFDQIKTGS